MLTRRLERQIRNVAVDVPPPPQDVIANAAMLLGGSANPPRAGKFPSPFSQRCRNVCFRSFPAISNQFGETSADLLVASSRYVEKLRRAATLRALRRRSGARLNPFFQAAALKRSNRNARRSRSGWS